MPFDFSLLKEALRKKHILNETKRKQLLQNLIKILKETLKRYGITEIFVFGSVVKERGFLENSDLDIAVKGLKCELFFKFMAEISYRMGKDVDVIELEKCRFADKILKEGIKIG